MQIRVIRDNKLIPDKCYRYGNASSRFNETENTEVARLSHKSSSEFAEAKPSAERKRARTGPPREPEMRSELSFLAA